MKTETMLGSVSARGFEKRGNTYANRAAQDETSPLLRVRAQTGESVRFELVQGPPAIARVFELTGLTSTLPFRDSPP